MPDPIFSSRSTACIVGPGHSLDLHSLDGAVQAYFAAGLAKSTHQTYKTAGKRYTDFCRNFALNPFPVTEPILCYFVACLGQQGLAPTTIKTYLSGVHQMQIAAGYPDINLPLQPRLHQVLKGVERLHGIRGASARPRHAS